MKQPLDDLLIVRVPSDFRALLGVASQKAGVKRSAYIRRVLTTAISTECAAIARELADPAAAPVQEAA